MKPNLCLRNSLTMPSTNWDHLASSRHINLAYTIHELLYDTHPKNIKFDFLTFVSISPSFAMLWPSLVPCVSINKFFDLDFAHVSSFLFILSHVKHEIKKRTWKILCVVKYLVFYGTLILWILYIDVEINYFWIMWSTCIFCYVFVI